jgi:cyclic pyranopterin phosphate synthase
MNLIGSLRISVTPSCNLDCVYCHKEGYYETVGPERMAPEEIARAVRVATELGVRKIKVTGGEPLLRGDIAEIIRRLSEIEKVRVLSLTTNGVLLKRFLEENPDLRLDRINVSLDTFRGEVYESITGRGTLGDVIAGIEKATSDGRLVEINMLMLKDINIGEIDDMIAFANKVGANIQFIELVKTEENEDFHKRHFYPLSKVEDHLGKRADRIEPRASRYDRMVYYIGNSQIVTCKVVRNPEECSGLRCKLLRITADGKIRFFMIKDDRYVLDLLGPMRSGASDGELRDIFLRAIELSKEIDRKRRVSDVS